MYIEFKKTLNLFFAKNRQGRFYFRQNCQRGMKKMSQKLTIEISKMCDQQIQHEMNKMNLTQPVMVMSLRKLYVNTSKISREGADAPFCLMYSLYV